MDAGVKLSLPREFEQTPTLKILELLEIIDLLMPSTLANSSIPLKHPFCSLYFIIF